MINQLGCDSVIANNYRNTDFIMMTNQTDQSCNSVVVCVQ